MSKKMSYADALNVVLEHGEVTEEVTERLTALKESLAKRNMHKSGPTKAQKENLELIEKIFEAMEPEQEYGTNDIIALVPELAGASSQKVSPLMKKLAASERITVEKVKNKAVYKVA